MCPRIADGGAEAESQVTCRPLGEFTADGRFKPVA